uniref:Ankyrin repeat domain-containing protein n=1 Tax=Sinocyclocheilus grahami TaxID=75366 RepID=A0A672R6F1_SINGR
SGQCLRVDTTLMGFEQMTWQRGNRSFIFRGQDSSSMVMEVDHDRQLVFCETLPCLSSSPTSLLGALQPSDDQVAARLSAPVVATQLDTRNISFERHVENLTLQQLFFFFVFSDALTLQQHFFFIIVLSDALKQAF